MMFKNPLSLPIFLVPIGEIGPEIIELVKKISMDLLYFDPNSFKVFHNDCKDRDIKLPTELRAKYHGFNSLSDFIDVYNLYKYEESIFLWKLYTIVFIVDCVLNPDFFAIQDQVENLFTDTTRNYFLFFRACDDIKERDRSFALYSSYMERTLISTVHQMCPTALVNSILSIPEFRNMVFMDKKSYLHYKNKFNIYFSLVSSDKNEGLASLEMLWKAYEKNKATQKIASLYEIIGLFEVTNPNTISKSLTMQKLPYEISPWTIYSDCLDYAFMAFSFSCSYYLKSQLYNKAADCAIRAVSLNYPKVIDFAVQYIVQSINDPNSRQRAWNLIEISRSKGNLRQTALAAFCIGQAFENESRIEFFVESLNLLRESGPNGGATSIIFCNIVLSLCVTSIDQSLLSHLILEVICKSGPRLPANFQTELFSRLRTIPSIEIEETFTFPLTVISSSIASTHYSIVDKEQASESSVFIYRSSAKTQKKALVAVGDSIIIELLIYNPYSIDICVDLSIRCSNMLTCSISNASIKAKSSRPVLFSVVPKSGGEIIIDQLLVQIYEVSLYSDMFQQFVFQAVDNAPVFRIKSNMPSSNSLVFFEGEKVDYSFRISNISDKIAINSINPKFDSSLSTVLKFPTTSCSVLNDVILSASFWIPSSLKSFIYSFSCVGSENSIETVFTEEKSICIEPSISIESIHPLDSIPEVDIELSSCLFFCIEIMNKSSEMFLFSASFRDGICISDDFLHQSIKSGLIYPKSSLNFLVACKKETISLSKDSIPAQYLAISKKAYEENTGEKLSSDDFHSIFVPLVAFASFIRENFSFEWRNANGRYGSIDLRTLIPEKSILNHIYNKPITFNYSYYVENQLCSIPPINKYISIKFCFSSPITRFELDVGNFKDTSSGLTWEGSLISTSIEGMISYEATILFLKPIEYQFYVCYQGIDSKNYKIPLLLKFQQ